MLLVPMFAAVTLSLSDSTGVGVRSVPETHGVSVDLTTYPAVTLDAASRRSDFNIGYRPRLGWVDLTDSRDFIVQHSAGATYTWSTRRLRLSLSAGGSYGRVTYYQAIAAAVPAMAMPTAGDTGAGNTGTGSTGTANPGTTTGTGGTPAAGQGQPMTGTPTQQAQYLPQVSILNVASASVGLNIGYEISRRWSTTFGIGYSFGGGLGSSERYLPFRHGPNAGVGVGYQLTKADGLTTTLAGGIDILPKRGSRFYTINLLETWTHKFSPLMIGTLGAGASYLQSRIGPHDPRTRSVNAAGIVSLARGFKLDGGALLGVSGGATLSTYYNPVLGTTYQSLSGGMGVGWSRKRLAFNAGVQASHSLPFDSPEAISTYGANAGTSYQLSNPISLYASAYWTHQVLPANPLLTIDPNRWGANIGITVAAPPIKL